MSLNYYVNPKILEALKPVLKKSRKREIPNLEKLQGNQPLDSLFTRLGILPKKETMQIISDSADPFLTDEEKRELSNRDELNKLRTYCIAKAICLRQIAEDLDAIFYDRVKLKILLIELHERMQKLEAQRFSDALAETNSLIEAERGRIQAEDKLHKAIMDGLERKNESDLKALRHIEYALDDAYENFEVHKDKRRDVMEELMAEGVDKVKDLEGFKDHPKDTKKFVAEYLKLSHRYARKIEKREKKIKDKEAKIAEIEKQRRILDNKRDLIAAEFERLGDILHKGPPFVSVPENTKRRSAIPSYNSKKFEQKKAHKEHELLEIDKKIEALNAKIYKKADKIKHWKDQIEENNTLNEKLFGNLLDKPEFNALKGKVNRADLDTSLGNLLKTNYKGLDKINEEKAKHKKEMKTHIKKGKEICKKNEKLIGKVKSSGIALEAHAEIKNIDAYLSRSSQDIRREKKELRKTRMRLD